MYVLNKSWTQQNGVSSPFKRVNVHLLMHQGTTTLAISLLGDLWVLLQGHSNGSHCLSSCRACTPTGLKTENRRILLMKQTVLGPENKDRFIWVSRRKFLPSRLWHISMFKNFTYASRIGCTSHLGIHWGRSWGSILKLIIALRDEVMLKDFYYLSKTPALRSICPVMSKLVSLRLMVPLDLYVLQL